MPETPLIRCVGLTKYFGGVLALNRASLDLMPGEIVCLVGDNGAGKSTLVKLLSGLHQPDEGEIWIGDEQVSGLTAINARERGIETVYQHLALCDNLGAAANVLLGQEPIRFGVGPFRFIDRKASVKAARKHIDDVGIVLDDYWTPVRRLSGGQRQAIAIARATVHGHRLIMLDEPTAALGVRQTKATLDLVKRVAASGVSVIVISHNLDDVFTIADRVVALRQGEITLNAAKPATSREEVVACMTGMSFQLPR
ncbi:MAG: ribose transport system ATP-binding protein [Gaiellales bacterium]|nr:ribose transport system ATP-binding protein [Gaiellales bacterium]